MRLFFATALLQLFVVFHSGAQDFLPVKDLSGDLLEFNDGAYVPADEGGTKAVYLLLKPTDYGNDYVRIRADDKFAVFVNGKLAAADQSIGVYNIDSLRKKFGASELMMSIYPLKLSTSSVEIVSRKKTGRAEAQLKRSSGFRDFAVIAILTL
jgi:hypothetical protein